MKSKFLFLMVAFSLAGSISYAGKNGKNPPRVSHTYLQNLVPETGLVFEYLFESFSNFLNSPNSQPVPPLEPVNSDDWPPNAVQNIEDGNHFPLGFANLDAFKQFVESLLTPIDGISANALPSIFYVVFHGSSVSGQSYVRRYRFDQGENPSDFDVALVSTELFNHAMDSENIDMKDDKTGTESDHTEPLNDEHLIRLGLGSIRLVANKIAPVNINGRPRETNFLIYRDLNAACYGHRGPCIVVEVSWNDNVPEFQYSYFTGGDKNKTPRGNIGNKKKNDENKNLK